MELGSLADWVSAGGGLLAVIAALIAWKVSRTQLSLEQRREGRAVAAGRRSQAELVFAIGAKLSAREDAHQWALFLVNASTKPVYEVVVRSQKLDGSGANAVLRLGALPPGRFVVPNHPRYHWGSLLDYARISEPVDLLVKGKGNQMVRSVDFLDSRRVAWRLANGTELSQAPAQSDFQE